MISFQAFSKYFTFLFCEVVVGEIHVEESVVIAKGIGHSGGWRVLGSSYAIPTEV